jgi:hypothetical protein
MTGNERRDDRKMERQKNEDGRKMGAGRLGRRFCS